MPPGDSRGRDLRQALKKAGSKRRGWIIGLDFDGTLSPIVRRPQSARLPAAMRKTLLRLARAPRVKLAFISGRALGDIAARVALPGAYYSGNHGLEIRGPKISWRHPQARACAPAIRRLSRELSREARHFRGALIENKGVSLTVHYRGMPQKKTNALRTLLARSLEPLTGSLRLAHGKKTWEVRPRTDWNKGHALLKIARAAGKSASIIFAGDDRTDEEGFRALGSRAISIKVGGLSKKTAARFRLNRQKDVLGLLELLIAVSHDE